MAKKQPIILELVGGPFDGVLLECVTAKPCEEYAFSGLMFKDILEEKLWMNYARVNCVYKFSGHRSNRVFLSFMYAIKDK